MKQTYWAGLILVVAIAAGVVFVTHNTAPAGTVTLGAIIGTTGDYAAVGEGFLNGFELAREEWNKSHTLQFSEVVEDDGFNAQKGLSAYTKLHSVDAPDAYVVLSSFTIDAILDKVHVEGKPVALGFEQSTPATDDNVFQLVPAARPIMQGLGSHVKALGYKKPVMLVSNNTSVYQNFAAGFADGYGEGVMKEVVTGSDASTIRALATKIVSEKPDLVTFFMDPPTGALLAKEILAQSKGAHPQFAFDQSIQSGIGDYQKIFGKTLSALDGSMIVLSKNDLTDDFKQKYEAQYHVQPPFGADAGYNAFMLLATSYTSSASGWVGAMKRANFTGADGTVAFSDVGLRVPNLAFGTLQSGQVVLK